MFIKESKYLVNIPIHIESIDIGIDQRKPHHRTSRCLNIAYDLIQPHEIMQTIGNSADFPNMKNFAHTAANHVILTPYNLHYNCGKLKLKYVSNSISFKFQKNV